MLQGNFVKIFNTTQTFKNVFVLKFELILIIGSNNVLTEGARKVYRGQGWSRQCGILNISQPYTPPRRVTGITFFFTFIRNCVYLRSWGGASVYTLHSRHLYVPQYLQYVCPVYLAPSMHMGTDSALKRLDTRSCSI
jgi:hypothetical protein